METPEVILNKMSKTLQKPKKKVANADYASFRAKLDALKQLDPSLVTLFRTCDAITTYIEQQRQEEAVTTQLAVDMKSLTTKTNANLKKIDSVQAGLTERINRFDLLEAKYSRMITRVNSVLEELERVLRQM